MVQVAENWHRFKGVMVMKMALAVQMKCHRIVRLVNDINRLSGEIQEYLYYAGIDGDIYKPYIKSLKNGSDVTLELKEKVEEVKFR